jgi:opacity protein-like surface antigen
MKKLVLLLLMLFVISSVAHAAPKKRSSSRKSSSSYGGSGKIGVGVIIGSISGLNVRILSNGPSAVNFDLAWDRHDNLFVAADYIINNKKPIQSLNGFPIYYGLGIKASTNDYFGARFILGTNFRLTDISRDLELFLEVAPGIQLSPSTDPDLDLGLGLRYYF